MRRLPTWREMHMDTSPEIEAMQFSFYRSAPTWRKLKMMSSLTRTARNLARLGLQDRYPNASDDELTQHLWDLLYPDHARIDFPKAATQDSEMREPELIDVALMVTTALEELGVTYAIGGSVASTLHGVPRSTVDADLVADLQAEHISPFVAALKEKFYVDPLSVMDAILDRSSFNLIHLGSMFKVDIFIPRQRDFDRNQLDRRELRTVTTQPDNSAWIASVEDTVLAKLEWFRLGGETSERQWRDVLGILKKQGKDIDTAYLRQQAADLNVADLLEQALIEAASTGRPK
jgi:hypothetical protein